MLKLKQLRKDAGLSIRALSERSGVPQRTIEDIEARGDCRISTKTNAFCLGIILCNVSRSFDYLIYPYYPAYTS